MRRLVRSNAIIPHMRGILGPICLRRAKNVIELPSRSDEIHRLDFQVEEAAHYNRMNGLISGNLDPGPGSTHLNAYANILTKINSLRQICNLGLLHRDYKCAPQRHKSPAIVAQELFEGMLSAGMAMCSVCRRDLTQSNVSNESLLGVEGRDHSQPRIAQCGQLVCAPCCGRLDTSAIGTSLKCKHQPSCQVFAVSIDNSTPIDINPSSLRLPSKVIELQNDLLAIPETEKR